MHTINVDFNARLEDGRLRLNTVGAQESLKEVEVKPGDWVFIEDDGIRAAAEVQDGGEHGLVAWYDEDTIRCSLTNFLGPGSHTLDPQG